MYANSERKAKDAGSEVPMPVIEGPMVSLAGMAVAETHKELEAPDLICILPPFCQHRLSPEGHRDLPGVTLPPLTWPQHPSPSPPNSHRDPNLRSELGESARGVRAPVQAPGVDTTGGVEPGAPRSKRRVVGLGGSLLASNYDLNAAVPFGELSISSGNRQ